MYIANSDWSIGPANEAPLSSCLLEGAVAKPATARDGPRGALASQEPAPARLIQQ